MRRPKLLAALSVAIIAAATTLASASAGSKASGVRPFVRQRTIASTAAGRGMVMRGLRYSGLVGRCGAGLYEIRAQGRTLGCTHGPDPAPAGVDARRRPSTASLDAGTPATVNAGIACAGDGVSGDRVQVLYGHPAGTDRFGALASRIRTWTAEASAAYNASAAETGGSRQIRFVTGKGCVLSIKDITFPASAISDFSQTIDYLHTHGHDAANRKYLVWMDAGVYCGIGEVVPDAQPSRTLNANNGPVPGMVARVDSSCWPQAGLDVLINGSVAGHELTHTLGAVQSTAPRHSAAGHCVDEYDLMCYVDGGGVQMTWSCPVTHQQLLDCGHDDYFSTTAPAGSYLAAHWNAANSGWLEVAPPANNAFKNAEPILAGTGSYVGSLVGANAQRGEPATAGVKPARSIWYTLKTPASGATLSLDTQGSRSNTVLGLYRGTNVNALTRVAQNDDSGGGTWSRIVHAVSGSTTYHVKVDARPGAGLIHLHTAYGASPEPVISSISPTSGPIGTTVTVQIQNLSGGFYIWVDGFTAANVHVAAGSITFDVPSTTADPASTPVLPGAVGPVVVEGAAPGAGYAISRSYFTVTP